MKYDEKYIELIESDKEIYYKDFIKFRESVNNSKAVYKGEFIPVTYQGFFFDKEDLNRFSKWSNIMIEIGRKVTREYLENEEYRKNFKYEKELEDLIIHDPGYDMPVVIGRYDIFYNGGEDFVFCELNTDGSSAMNEEEEITKRFLKTKGIRDFSNIYNLKLERFELFYSLIDKLTDLYNDIKGDNKPNIAIVDFIDKGSNEEFEVFKNKFIEKGYNCVICDPREVKYEDGKLKYGDFNIDLVYRRAVTRDLMDRKEEIKDFLSAYKDNAFLMFGSFRSQLMHSKLIFKILRLEETKKILTDDENSFISKHIPYTEELINDEDYMEVLENKDKYILKPYDGYASSGIYVGRDYSKEEFENILKNIKRETYIYQDYYDVNPTKFLIFDDEGKLDILEFSHVLGLFIYGEEFSGMYSRIGRSNIVSALGDYFMAPNIKISRRID